MSVKIDNKKILKSAVKVAEIEGFIKLTRQKIAEHANVSDAKVSNAYGSMTQLRRAVMRQAIAKNIYTIIVDGIVSKDPTALKLSDEEKSVAFQAVL